MIGIGTIISAVAAPLISGLFKLATRPYVDKAIVPIVDKVKEIEINTSGIPNSDKHTQLLNTILRNSAIVKIINKFGWNKSELNKIIAFIVLLVKKNPSEVENRNKWNDADTKIVFNFFQIIISKWLHIFRRK